MGRCGRVAGSDKNERCRGDCRLPAMPDKAGLALLTEAVRADIRAVNGERELRQHKRGDEQPDTDTRGHSDGVITSHRRLG